MVTFHGLCDGKRMVRKTKFFWILKCLNFSQTFRAPYLIGGYASCIKCSVLHGVLTAFMLYAETH